MNRQKENSRFSATEATARKCEVTPKHSHKNYTTVKTKMQGLFSTFIVISIILLTVWVIIDISYENYIELKPIEHKVAYGDTLWTIAQKYKPENMTMDSYMAWVYEHNEGGMIYPGDTVIMAEVVG